jgi:glycosyltransferase involved in cell wall biosynthesis
MSATTTRHSARDPAFDRRDRPLVSVVIPAYNHAAYLDESIHSVLAQDYSPVELIVLDDGSTDETRDVLQKYGQQFTWESHANLGQAATLNKGFRMAKGDILSYLAADDRLEPHAVRRSVDMLEEHPEVVMTYCDFTLLDPESRVVRRVMAPEFNYRQMVLELVCAPGPGVFWRRTASDAVGGWNPAFRMGPDYDFWLRLGLVGPLRRIPESLAFLRVHPGSQSFQVFDIDRSEEPVRIIEGYFRTQRVPGPLQAKRNQAVSFAHLLAARSHLRAGRYRRTWASLRQSAALYPSNVRTLRAGRLLLNALFNRFGHQLLWFSRRQARRRARATGDAD